MSTRTLKIKEALAEVGINAEEVETIKNGVMCTGFRIVTDHSVSPIVYYSEDETVEEYVNRVIKAKLKGVPSVNIEKLLNKDNILKNCYICTQKRSNEDIIKRDYLNLEEYIRIGVSLDKESDYEASVKVNSAILDISGISKEEIFDAARKNSLNRVKIKSIEEILGLPNILPGDMSMYVATYENNHHGSGVLVLKESFHKFCMDMNVTECYILPCSVEELILLTGSDYSTQELVTMVSRVNETEVEDILQLEPVVYYYDVAVNEVSIAASFLEGGVVA